MAYLSLAMGEVIAVLQSQNERKSQLAQKLSDLDAKAQLDIISKFSAQFPMLDPKGTVVRNLAMQAWWSEQK
jgi:ethanolamine utilization protein EutP (predicted NTPase)